MYNNNTTNEIIPIQFNSSSDYEDKQIARSRIRVVKEEHIPPRYTPSSSEEIRNKQSSNFYILSVIPMIIFTYIQVLFNLIMVGLVLCSIWKLKTVLSADLAKHLDKQEHLLLGKILDCSRDYLKNKCNAFDVPPALEGHCSSWRLCMEQDTQGFLKSAESAAVLAQIMNNFFDSLTNRTICCSAGLILGSIFFANFTLSWSKRISSKCV